MKKFGILWLIILFFSIDISAQKIKKKKKASFEKEFIFVSDPAPEFPGGDDSLMRFIQDNFKFSNLKLDSNEQIPATIVLEITITKSGKVKYFSTRKTSNVSLINECKRLASIMPKWKPVSYYKTGKIDCRMDIPINIFFED